MLQEGFGWATTWAFFVLLPGLFSLSLVRAFWPLVSYLQRNLIFLKKLNERTKFLTKKTRNKSCFVVPSNKQ
jgi:hypothetical protein